MSRDQAWPKGARKQVNDPTAPCIQCGNIGQMARQLCSACYQLRWYTCRWAPPAKACPPDVAAEIQAALDGHLVEPENKERYIEPTTRDCMDNLDRTEIETAAETNWKDLEDKSRRELNEAKSSRDAGKQWAFCVPNRTIGKKRHGDDDE